MKKLSLIIAASTLYLSAAAQRNDFRPIDVEVYQLENGLTVILNEDHNLPQVFGSVIVRAGAKDDPKGATGMAHYQEHMLFKGTETSGTTNWEAEKPHIENIFKLYDDLSQTTDPVERTVIQGKINEESLKANEYAIPNELSNLIKSTGGTSLNAATGADITYFYNAFPPSQVEKWIDLYSHRFEKPVFRSFQAELEVVYEEKNMYSDIFILPLLENFNKHFYKNHPYGQQTTIGTIEDLKNPSLSKMYQFFKTWYVPNNMALIIVGDFDKKLVKPMIAEKFGKWEKKELPERPEYKEEPFNGREFVEVKLSPVKLALLGFRSAPASHPDEIAFKICNAILSNQSQTGLLDKLIQDNKLMSAQVINMQNNDYSASIIFALPKIIGQKLSSAEKLVLAELEKLKTGDFDSSFVENTKMELYREYQLNMEKNQNKSMLFAQAYGRNQTMYELLQYPELLMKVTKNDVMKVAAKYYGDNYLAFYSKMGFPKKKKIDKPGYKPMIANTTASSEYAKKLQNIPETKENLKFFNFEKDVDHIAVSEGMNIYCVKNPVNNVFNLKVKFKIGNKNNPDLKYAADLMNYASPEGMSLDSFKAKIASVGCTYDISGDESYTVIEMTGIESGLKDALALISQLVDKPLLEQSKIEVLYEGEKANRKFELSEPDEVAKALYSFVRYGDKSEFINRLSLSEIKSLQAARMTDAFKFIVNYGAEIHYSGNTDPARLAELFAKAFKTGIQKVETPFVPEINQYTENTVFFVDKKKASQSKVYYLVNGVPFDPKFQADMDAFNLYFGGDFSGLVLQEIREYRSLAYSAGAKFKTPQLKGKEAYFAGYVGTQADKTIEAMGVFDTLIRQMPLKKDRLKMIRQYLMLSSVGDKPDFRNLSEQMVNWKNQGYETDPVQYKREAYENMSFDNILGFYKNYLAGKPVAICIVGDKSRIDTNKLSKFGKLVFVKESSLFSK